MDALQGMFAAWQTLRKRELLLVAAQRTQTRGCFSCWCQCIWKPRVSTAGRHLIVRWPKLRDRFIKRGPGHTFESYVYISIAVRAVRPIAFRSVLFYSIIFHNECDQVNISNHTSKKTLWFCHSYSLHSRTLKLGVLHKEISINISYFSEFSYRWPKVKSILWPLHYKSIGENSNTLLLAENTLKHRDIGKHDKLNRKIASVTPCMLLRSSQVMKHI